MDKTLTAIFLVVAGGIGVAAAEDSTTYGLEEKRAHRPAWVTNINFAFQWADADPRLLDALGRLHAPQQTVVEGVFRDGKVQSLRVTPESRRADLTVVAK